MATEAEKRAAFAKRFQAGEFEPSEADVQPTPEDLKRARFLQQMFSQPELPGAVHTTGSPSPKPRPPSTAGDIPKGFQRGLEDLKLGFRQLMSGASENPLLGSAGMPADIQEAMAAPRVGRPSQEELFQKVAERRTEAKQNPSSILTDLSSGLTKAAPFVAASVTPGAQSMAAQMALGLGAATLDPSASVGERRTKQALGLGLPLAIGTVTRTISPKTPIEPERLAAVKAARREGQVLTGGQIADDEIVKLAEAHAVWNPLTKRFVRQKLRGQTDEFIRKTLERVGVPPSQIAKNPTLNPATLNQADQLIGARLDDALEGVTNVSFRDPTIVQKVGLLQRNFSQHIAEKEEARGVQAAAQKVLQLVDDGRVSPQIFQQRLRSLDGNISRLYEKGYSEAAKAVQDLSDDLVSKLPKAQAFRQAQGDFARLKTVEDALRKSSGMGEGTLDPLKLAGAIERKLPGGVIRGRSTQADLARAGLLMRLPNALPERVTGIPRWSDPANAFTYFRFNNPIATAGFLNQPARNQLEALLQSGGTNAVLQLSPRPTKGPLR